MGRICAKTIEALGVIREKGPHALSELRVS